MQKDEKRKMENNYKEQCEELVKNYQDFKEVVINKLDELKGGDYCDYDVGYNTGVEHSIAVVADMAIPLIAEVEKQPSFLLRRLEYELLKYWKDKGYKYIARDRDLTLYLYKEEEPIKNDDVWATEYGQAECHSYFDDFFQFIEWTDKYPFNIEKLLNTSEVIEND